MELSWLAVWGTEAWVYLMLLHGNNTETRATSSAPTGAKSGLIGTIRIGDTRGGVSVEPGGILFGPY